MAAADLVPGDIIVLEEGDSISADARLVRQYELSTNNIALTGESDAVRKTADPIVEEELATINMPNLVFMGTSVASGTGRAVVFATGLKTEFGRIYSADRRRLRGQVTSDARDRQDGAHGLDHRADLRRPAVLHRLDRLQVRDGRRPAVRPGRHGGAWCPRALPATLSVALAVGVQRMAKAKALIKKLAGVETLGCTNVIATDKTGTLTKAEMTRQGGLGRTASSSRSPARATSPIGDFVVGDTMLPKDEARRRLEPLLRAMTFCNDAKVLAAQRRQGLARDRRPHRGLPPGRRAQGRLRSRRRSSSNGPRSTSCRSSRCASACRSCTSRTTARRPTSRARRRRPSGAARTSASTVTSSR